ncbi:type II toxin-antitoxin system RelE family toxin [Brucella intermedia]|uniref:type II toxin-antitoxin system RelE family toxin n=1 Tax=Brucella intermedia TaxID=94625 RepID=UPI0007C64667|nr:type II toxin-antitoxin system RelE/ParE family toxin [Brucella intermedia]OAE43947.1 cytotoxic translational repressor of toxin-antitoxin stability system [Brucella intermedia]
MKQITYSREATKTLIKMPANTAKLIRSKIEQYAADPASLANNVKALKGGEGVFRLRVGDWRVLFTDEGEIIAIVRIAPRGSVYE